MVGVVFGLILFFIAGIGQSWQTQRARREEEPSGMPELARPRAGLAKWVRTHPWMTGASGGLLLTAVTMVRLLAEGRTLGSALLFSVALGAGLFVFAGLVGTLARQRER
jgi:hypothetical protein